MRKLIFFCVLLACFGNMEAQHINVARHSYVDVVSNLVSIGSRHFYTENIFPSSNSPLGFSDSANFVGIGKNGQFLFKINFNFNEAFYFFKTVKTLDNCLLVYGLANGCDFDFDAKIVLRKIDTNGVIKFQKVIASTVDTNYLFQDCFQHPDSSYYFIADSVLHHFSKNGQIISLTPIPLAYPRCMTRAQNGLIFLNGSDNNFNAKNMLLSVTGSVVSQQSSVNDYEKVLQHSMSGNFFALGYSGLSKINSSLIEVVSTANTLSTNISITDFVLRGDSIYFTGTKTPSNTPVYGILGLNLNPIYISQTTYKKIIPTGIALSGANRVNIIANATSSLVPSQISQGIGFISFYQFPINGTFLSTPDVGVLNYTTSSAFYNPSTGINTTNLKVTVKNYSADTIKNFYLNTRSFQGICNFRQFHKFFSNVILPNGTATVQTGDFWLNLSGPTSNIEGSTFPQDVCLFTTVPNQQSDNNIDNDAACQTIQMLVTGITPVVLPSFKEFEIYPNPFTNSFTVESSSEIQKIKIFNAMGALITDAAPMQTIYNFYNSGLSSGLYIIQVETKNGIITKKVIKN